MALELIGGAVFGTAVADLWKAVIDGKHKASAFQPALARLESTLKATIPRHDQISRMNYQLNLQHPEMEELLHLITNGTTLVVKCSKISTINLVKKVRYTKELLDLDRSLKRYFMTILPLEILVAVKRMEMKLAGMIDGGVCNQSESSAGKPKEEDLESEALEAMKLLQDSDKEAAVKLCQDSKKEEIVKSNPKIVEINKSGKEYKKSESTDGPKESGENLFLFEWCPHNFNLEEILRSETEMLDKGIYGTNYWCNTKYGVVEIKRLEGVKVGEMEFEQQIKHLGKFGQHPNVLLLLGYYSSEFEKFLIHAHLPMGSLSAFLHGYSGSERSPLDWISRMKIALGTARGISHLHSEGGVNFIHGNIKSSNVLLTPNLNGCISDYGFAPLVDFDATPPQEEGYHAPEVPLPKKVAVSQYSDVYSFGVVLLEIITRKRPADTSLPMWINSVDRKEWAAQVFDKELFQYLHNCEEQMVRMTEIALMCVDAEPVRRPKMHDVVRMIETIQPCKPKENSGSGVNYEMPQVITLILMVHMHCEDCAKKIKKRIMRMKGVESAEPDLKSSQVTVTGVFDPPKLVEYVYKRTGKHAAIVKQEPEKKEEDKGKDAMEEKKGEDGGDKEKKGGGGDGGEKEEKKDKGKDAKEEKKGEDGGDKKKKGGGGDGGEKQEKKDKGKDAKEEKEWEDGGDKKKKGKKKGGGGDGGEKEEKKDKGKDANEEKKGEDGGDKKKKGGGGGGGDGGEKEEKKDKGKDAKEEKKWEDGGDKKKKGGGGDGGEKEEKKDKGKDAKEEKKGEDGGDKKKKGGGGDGGEKKEKKDKGKDAKEKKKGKDGGEKEKKGGGAVGREKEEKKDGGGEEAKAVAAEGEEETNVDVELKRNEFYYYPQKYAMEYYAYPPQIFSDENPNACSVM